MVIKLSVKRFYLGLISILVIFSIIFNSLLSNAFVANIFLYSIFVHMLISLYIICSFLENNVLQEKQGSKLDMSKSKLS